MLFDPLTLNGLTLPNRICVPAMVTRLCGEDGFVNADITDRYMAFARGEAGLIVVEAMAVHRSKSGPLLRICGDEFKPGLSELARKMHAISPSKVAPQIIHFLKISRSGWRQKVSDLSIGDIKQIVREYAQAALRARECGFDAVELHMAHAYTLSSFLSRLNARRDDYGGSLENRLRAPLEVLAAVRAAVGRDFAVGIRFDADECIKGGYTVEESRAIALRLAQVGADWLSLSAGGKFEDAQAREGEPLYPYTGYSGERTMPGASYPDGANLYMAEGVKAYLRAHGVKTPVLATGKIGTPELAERVLREGHADLIGIARPILADPMWPKKTREGRFDKVIRCCYANVCKARDEHFQTVSCFLWPKGAKQAPQSDDSVAPVWPAEGASLSAAREHGRVVLHWNPATDNEAVYGYDVWREELGQWRRLSALPSGITQYHDAGAIPGISYAYRVQAYDFAGNRSEVSNIANLGA
ncbi:MAG: NADH:flavin oxidoreductase [Planctomycetes bacterium]|nr:NADH:flavin oxidoreductase [Planctomycetota bacterium]